MRHPCAASLNRDSGNVVAWLSHRGTDYNVVMAGLVPAIHGHDSQPKTWMPGTSPGLTTQKLPLQF